MEDSHNERQYRIFNRMPKSVPPFDSAFVNLGHKEGLNVLLKAAPESCLLTCISDGTRAAYALRQIYKRKFKLCGTGIELNLSDLSFSGRVVFFFARGLDSVPHTSPFFCRGPTMIYELAHSQGNVIDMFALGHRFHERLKESGYKGKSLVFVEE